MKKVLNYAVLLLLLTSFCLSCTHNPKTRSQEENVQSDTLETNVGKGEGEMNKEQSEDDY